MTPLQENIQIAVTRMSEYLAEHKTATSWQLKLMLRVSSSVLFLALGVLYGQGKISLVADGLNYHVLWGGTPEPQAPVPPTPPVQENM